MAFLGKSVTSSSAHDYKTPIQTHFVFLIITLGRIFTRSERNYNKEKVSFCEVLHQEVTALPEPGNIETD